MNLYALLYGTKHVQVTVREVVWFSVGGAESGGAGSGLAESGVSHTRVGSRNRPVGQQNIA